MSKQNTNDQTPSKTNFAKPMLPACGIRSWKEKLSKLRASLKNKIVALCPTKDKPVFKNLFEKNSNMPVKGNEPLMGKEIIALWKCAIIKGIVVGIIIYLFLSVIDKLTIG